MKGSKLSFDLFFLNFWFIIARQAIRRCGMINNYRMLAINVAISHLLVAGFRALVIQLQAVIYLGWDS